MGKTSLRQGRADVLTWRSQEDTSPTLVLTPEFLLSKSLTALLPQASPVSTCSFSSVKCVLSPAAL